MKPRRPVEGREPAQVLNALLPFIAVTGSYEVSGDTLTLHFLVALRQEIVGESRTMKFKIEGNTLTLSDPNGNAGNAFEKFVRVE